MTTRQFEYKPVEAHHLTEAQLNVLGAEGWQLIGIDRSELHGGAEGATYVFVRERVQRSGA